MSREIKFRAWDKEEKEYYYNAEHTYDFFCSGRGCYAESFGEVLNQPDRFVAEQYTGLKDKNGKEIYEGDIIKARDWDGDWGKYRIKWKPSHCAFEAFECRKHGKWNWTLQGFGGIEVIGNIHENPELLEYK